MDIHEYTLIVGMANRLNYVYDIRKLDEPIQRRDSSLKFMTRCIKLTPSGDGIAQISEANDSVRIIIHRRKNSLRRSKSLKSTSKLRLQSSQNRKPTNQNKHSIPGKHIMLPSCTWDICKWRWRRFNCDLGYKR